MANSIACILVSCLLVVIEANDAMTQKTTTKSFTTSVKKSNLTTLFPGNNNNSLPNEQISILKRLENLQNQILKHQSEGIQRIKTQQYENEAKFEVILQTLDKIKSRPTPSASTPTTPSASTTSTKVTYSLPTLTVNGKQYYFSHNKPKKNWEEADKFCRANGMFLVSLEAEGELESLKSEYQKNPGTYNKFAWTSGVYVENELQWIWSRENITIKGFNLENFSIQYQTCLCADETRFSACNCRMGFPFVCES